jgi:hypothetical protein
MILVDSDLEGLLHLPIVSVEERRARAATTC